MLTILCYGVILNFGVEQFVVYIIEIFYIKLHDTVKMFT